MIDHIHVFSTEEELNEHRSTGCNPCVALVEENDNEFGLVESLYFTQGYPLAVDSSVTFYYGATNIPNITQMLQPTCTQTVFTTFKDGWTAEVTNRVLSADGEVTEITISFNGVDFDYEYACESDNGYVWLSSKELVNLRDSGSILFPLFARGWKRNPEVGDSMFIITNPFPEEDGYVFLTFGGRNARNYIPTLNNGSGGSWISMYELIYYITSDGASGWTEYSADTVWPLKCSKYVGNNGGKVFYNNPTKRNEYYDKPLTFEITQGGYLNIDSRRIGLCDGENPGFLRFRIDGGPWYGIYTNQTWGSGDYIFSQFLSKGQKVEFEGDTTEYGNKHDYNEELQDWDWNDVINYPLFVCGTSNALRFNVYGNIMSLCKNYVKPSWEASIKDSFYFGGIFASNFGIDDASNLVLPEMCLASACYAGMFAGSTISKAPKLPATVLAFECYKYMFAGCQNLSKAPKLPAKVMFEGCYSGMFAGCIKLTKAPELPATSLAKKCYGGHVYTGMFNNCSGLESTPELPATTLAEGCYCGMFGRCFRIKSIKLPATILTTNCYRGMLQECTGLNQIVCNAVSGINQNNSTTAWLEYASSAGTFFKNANATWPTGINGILQYWTVVDIPADN